MPTPPKPYKVLKSEKKSHRTKAELSLREKGEKALSTDKKIKERKEVRNDKIAHKEFKRIIDLLENIDKNDAIYEAVINRYCLLQSECQKLEQKEEELYNLIFELKEENKLVTEELIESYEEAETIKTYRLDYAKQIQKMINSVLTIDRNIAQKRKMLLDIEKENIMTIASALRSIPKKEEKQENPLLKILRGEEECL